MTAHHRTARAFTLGAGGSAAVGLYVATTVTPWLIVVGIYGFAFCAWCSKRYYAAHRRQLAEAEWERQYVLGGRPAPLNPCCALADHSGGAAHDRRKCTDPFHRITSDLAAEPRSST